MSILIFDFDVDLDLDFDFDFNIDECIDRLHLKLMLRFNFKTEEHVSHCNLILQSTLVADLKPVGI